jgi:hypothetical protein
MAIDDAEVAAVLAAVRTPEDVLEAGRTFTEMLRAGRIPVEAETTMTFYRYVVEHAARSRDLESFERALRALERRVGRDEEGAAFVEDARKRLDALRGETER